MTNEDLSAIEIAYYTAKFATEVEAVFREVPRLISEIKSLQGQLLQAQCRLAWQLKGQGTGAVKDNVPTDPLA